MESLDFWRYFDNVKFKKQLLKYFKGVFQFQWVTQIECIDYTHEQQASICHTFAVLQNLFPLYDYRHVAGTLVFLCPIWMDDNDLNDLMTAVLFHSFLADTLWKHRQQQLEVDGRD